MPKASNDVSRPVPGGSSQKAKGTATTEPKNRSATKGGTGSNRGVVGSGTVDRLGRTRTQQAARAHGASGNYGGGTAGVTYGSGRRPPNARRRG